MSEKKEQHAVLGKRKDPPPSAAATSCCQETNIDEMIKRSSYHNLFQILGDRGTVDQRETLPPQLVKDLLHRIPPEKIKKRDDQGWFLALVQRACYKFPRHPDAVFQVLLEWYVVHFTDPQDIQNLISTLIGHRVDSVEHLVKKHPQWFSVDHLHWVLRRGFTSLSLIQNLVETVQHQQPQDSDDWKKPLLHLALEKCTTQDIVEYLVDLYPDGVKEKNEEGLLPIHGAALKRGSPSLVQFLADQYPEGIVQLLTSGKHSSGKSGTLLHHIFEDPFDSRIFHRHGLRRRTEHGVTRIVKIVEILCHKCPNVTQIVDSDKSLPIHVACDRGLLCYFTDAERAECLRLLLGPYPASLTRPNKDGKVPLSIACDKMHRYCRPRIPEMDMLRLLTPTHLTVLDFMLQGHGDLSKFLLDNPQVTDDKTGNTALHMVAQTDCLYMAQQIATKVPEQLRIPNKAGDLPLHVICRSAPHCQVPTEFYEPFMDGLKMRNHAGELPVHVACQSTQINEPALLRLMEACPEEISAKLSSRGSAIHLLLRHHPLFEKAIGVALRHSYHSVFGEGDENGDLPFMVVASQDSSLSALYSIVRKRPDVLFA